MNIADGRLREHLRQVIDIEETLKSAQIGISDAIDIYIIIFQKIRKDGATLDIVQVLTTFCSTYLLIVGRSACLSNL